MIAENAKFKIAFSHSIASQLHLMNASDWTQIEADCRRVNNESIEEDSSLMHYEKDNSLKINIP